MLENYNQDKIIRKNTQDVALTRLLYIKDEVMYSLINSILVKKDIRECYFWLGEWHYSDPQDEWDIFTYIWKIYLDFYAVYNPTLERYIQTKQKKWEKIKEYSVIVHIFHNLFYLKISSEVFQLRQYLKETRNKMFIYKKNRNIDYKWLSNYPAIYHTLLIAIKKKHTINACVHVKNLMDNVNVNTYDIYRVILRYYSASITMIDDKKIVNRWRARRWNCDDLHGIIAIVVHLSIDSSEIKHPLVFKVPSCKEMKLVLEHNDNIIKRHDTGHRVYRILRDFRLYDVHRLTNLFRLSRNTLNNINSYYSLFDNWEYYAYQTPLWRERIDRCGGYFVKQELLFQKDYEEKTNVKKYSENIDFNDHYNLEPDEQSIQTQLRGIAMDDVITMEEWIREVFDSQSILQIDNIQYE